MRYRLLFGTAFFIWLGIIYVYSFTLDKNNQKPRLLVLTDIGGDPDDIQSLRRLLVYSNEFRIEGIIATATNGVKGKRQRGKYYTFENLIYDAINDYEKVQDNLMLHAEGYPEANELRSLVKVGQPNRGVDKLAPGLSTSGSRHIIAVVDRSDEPIYITIWGGAHDLAQALLDVKSTRTKEEIDHFISKIRVYAINDQDKIYPDHPVGTGEWILENFPGVWYVEAGPPWVFRPVSTALYRGMYQNDADAATRPMLDLVRKGQEFNQQEWVEQNIKKWGALGSGYPADVNLNPNSPRNTRGAKEGDTPSWFYVLPHGLNNPEFPSWGGWGGRFEHHSGGHFTDAQDDHWSDKTDGSLRRKWTVARWREAYQNDFAARMQWCVLPYKEANHNPVLVVERDATKNVINRDVSKGQSIKLDARASFDPDRDKLSFNWWIYQEASSSVAIILNHQKKAATLEIPASAPAGDIHVILEVTDDGQPKLFSYRRIVLRVISKE